MNSRTAIVGLGAAVAVAVLAGCGARSGGGPVASGSGTPSAASATPSVAPSVAPSAAPQTCRTGQLAISLSGGDAGLGHRSKVVVFRNTGPASCVLQGYPGVALLDADGRQVAQAKRTPNGYMGGLRAGTPPLVTLASGDSASATVEALAFDANGNACPPSAGVLVTPPDETRSLRLDWGSNGCGELQIHPVVPGTTGQSG